jgi:DNA modification methylase
LRTLGAVGQHALKNPFYLVERQHEVRELLLPQIIHWAGDRKQTTVWAIPHRKSVSGHGTEKPVECMKRPIENNSSPGQAVYQPFSGSGTTIIAAEMTGRCCHAIELNPAYVDVAVKRWQEFTGQTATLEGDGRTFAELGAERLAEAA